MEHRHRVEGEHHLLVGAFAPETHVQLVEVLLQDLRGLLDPDIRQLPLGEGDGLELLRIIQPLEDDAVSVGTADAQVGVLAGEQLRKPPFGDHLTEQGVGGVPVGGRHRTHHQDIAQGQRQQPVQKPLHRKHAFPTARPAIEDQVAVGVVRQIGAEQGVKGPPRNGHLHIKPPPLPPAR